MQLPPLTVLLSWPTPNYVDPVDHGVGLLIVNLVLTPLTIAFVGLRLYTRIRISRSTGFDDVLIVLALILVIVLAVLTIVADNRYGWTRHIWDVRPQWLSQSLKIHLAYRVVFTTAYSLTKISMLSLYRRIVSSSARLLYNVIISIAISIIALEGTTNCLVNIFQCRPVHKYWELTAKSNCLNEDNIIIAASIISIFNDFFVVSLPIPILWKMQMPIRRRILVITLFAMGFLICAAGIVKAVYIHRIEKTYDKTWESYPILICCASELDVGIICASVPTINPFFNKYLPKLWGSHQKAPEPDKANLPPGAQSGGATALNETLDSTTFDGEEVVSMSNILAQNSLDPWMPRRSQKTCTIYNEDSISGGSTAGPPSYCGRFGSVDMFKRRSV